MCCFFVFFSQTKICALAFEFKYFRYYCIPCPFENRDCSFARSNSKCSILAVFRSVTHVEEDLFCWHNLCLVVWCFSHNRVFLFLSTAPSINPFRSHSTLSLVFRVCSDVHLGSARMEISTKLHTLFDWPGDAAPLAFKDGLGSPERILVTAK